MARMVIIKGAELRSLLAQLGSTDESIRHIRIDQRGDKVAVKVNEGMWSPSIGEKQGPY